MVVPQTNGPRLPEPEGGTTMSDQEQPVTLQDVYNRSLYHVRSITGLMVAAVGERGGARPFEGDSNA